jgi:hypothetical protein
MHIARAVIVFFLFVHFSAFSREFDFPIEFKPAFDSDILLLKGACSSGKSSLLRHIREQDPSSEILTVEEDVIVTQAYLKAIADLFPFEYVQILTAIDSFNLYPALRYRKFTFMPTSTAEECANAEEALHKIQDALNLDEMHSWKKQLSEQIEQEIFDQIASSSRSKTTVILDSWYISAKTLDRQFPVSNEKPFTSESQVKTLLLYCPFSVMYQRFLKRNEEAEQLGNFENYRQLRQLLSFFSLFDLKIKQNKLELDQSEVLEELDLDELNLILDKISTSLEDLPTSHLRENFTFQEISRSEFEWLRNEYGSHLREPGQTCYVVPKNTYDFIVNTGRD